MQSTTRRGAGFAPEPVEPIEPVNEPLFVETSPNETPPDQKQNPPSRRGSSTPFPGDFTIDGEPLRYAIEKGLSEQRARFEFERIKNWAEAKDERKVDWLSAWRNWVLGEVAKNGESPQPKDPNRLERGLARAG